MWKVLDDMQGVISCVDTKQIPYSILSLWPLQAKQKGKKSVQMHPKIADFQENSSKLKVNLFMLK